MVERDSFAAKAGLNVGTVISQISQKNVKTPKEVKKLLEDMKKKGADAALIQVFENKFGYLKNLSILDLLFNLGPESKNFIRTNSHIFNQFDN